MPTPRNRDRVELLEPIRAIEAQRNASDAYIKMLKEQIKRQDNSEDYEWNIRSVTLDFFTEARPDMIEPFVVFVFTQAKAGEITVEQAVDAVAYFHDEHVDLSTIRATGDHFKPWPK